MAPSACTTPRQPRSPCHPGAPLASPHRHRQKRSDYIVLTAREGDPHEEARTHRMFRHLLLDGEREWFHSGPDLLAHLCIVARGDYAPPPDVRDEPIGLDDF